MVSSKSMAIVVSGLAITGTTVLGLGLSPAGATGPGAVPYGWGRHGGHCCGGQFGRLSSHNLTANRHHQRIIIVNHLNVSNISKNNNDTRQGLKNQDNPTASSAAAAGGGGGGAG